MREDTEQQAPLEPLIPLAPILPEASQKRGKFIQLFLTDDASSTNAPIIDLQRRACWLGVTLILQALNEIVLLIPIFLPSASFLTPWIGLTSFCLIGSSFVSLWMAFRPATLQSESGEESAIAHRRPRRWQRIVVILLLITSLGGAAEIVASTVMGFFMTPIYRNDGTSLDMNAAILLVEGKDPYVDSSILTVVRRFSILPIWTTPLRQGQFANSSTYPTPDQLSSVLAQDLKTGKAPEFESKVSYPAFSFLTLVPFVLIKTNNALPLYLLSYLAIVFIGWRKLRPEMRPWLLLIALANASMLTSVLNGNVDIFNTLLILLAWLLLDARWWSAMLLGLALATKQLAWFFLPFYAILIWRRYGLREAIGRVSIAALLMLAINLPFILWNPHAWLAGVLAPIADPMYPLGAGLVALSLTSILPLLPGIVYSVLEAIAMLLCLLWYWRICKSRPETAMLLAVLPLFFAWRSLPSYFYCAALPLFILYLVRVQKHSHATPRAGTSPARTLMNITNQNRQ